MTESAESDWLPCGTSRSAPAIIVFVPKRPGSPPPPRERPLATCVLESELLESTTVVFSDLTGPDEDRSSVAGLTPVTLDRWEDVTADPVAIYDRWPSQARGPAWHAARARLGHRVWGNGAALQSACRDKLQTHRILQQANVPTPALVSASQTAAIPWPAAFAKPRYGAFGAGVCYLRQALPVPGQLPGLTGDEPAVLQEAVEPWRPQSQPDAFIAVRALVQWAEDRWTCRTPVARLGFSPVVNVARGAQVAAAGDVFGAALESDIRRVALMAAEAVAAPTREPGELALEVGVDLVVDTHGTPHVIEVNHKPRGHLKALATAAPARFGREHSVACATPLLALLRAANTATTFNGA